MDNVTVKYHLLKMFNDVPGIQERFNLIVSVQQFCEELKTNLSNFANAEHIEVVIDSPVEEKNDN